MNCPYCNKLIPAMTGLQEAQKFQKHLRTCKKNPENKTVVNDEGKLRKVKHDPDLMEAVKIRNESGQ